MKFVAPHELPSVFPSSHINYLATHGDSPNLERIEKMSLDAISISESKLSSHGIGWCFSVFAPVMRIASASLAGDARRMAKKREPIDDAAVLMRRKVGNRAAGGHSDPSQKRGSRIDRRGRNPDIGPHVGWHEELSRPSGQATMHLSNLSYTRSGYHVGEGYHHVVQSG